MKLLKMRLIHIDENGRNQILEWSRNIVEKSENRSFLFWNWQDTKRELEDEDVFRYRVTRESEFKSREMIGEFRLIGDYYDASLGGKSSVVQKIWVNYSDNIHLETLY